MSNMLDKIFMKESNISVPVIITNKAISTAEKFAREQYTQAKAQQVYLNTLAVYLVDNYLRVMGIETDLPAGDSWNPAVRFAADVADLEITGVGRLECLPVVNQAEKCDLPLEVIDDRIGYVIVSIDLQQKEAYLLGFTEKITTNYVYINQLLSVETLLEHINQLKQKTSVVKLSQWLNNTFESSWQLLSDILASPSQELNFNFRDSQTIIRGKKLDLIQGQEAVALCVGVNPVFHSEMAIYISLYPTEQQVLPTGLQLMLFNEQGKLEMQAEAGKNDQFLKFQFTGELGENFCVKICWGNVDIAEKFII
ncbi:DUF1822 family protein [Nodularia spumigena CS-586/05]|uniref:DUF1822 family protein n=2 Tax=Nodularia spumigena TaxID=70799 RepID=UPI00232D74E4|nr:DUF1822 family protein [Nodularia spumigena]MDB9370955.1 DUF1822 family protein [Nodularia spumigena CS-586/05]